MIRPAHILLAASLSVLVFAPAGAASDAQTLLGTSRDWSAFTSGSGSAKTCYALAKPSSTLPKKVKRDPIYFLVTDWPARKVKSEPEVVPGYVYKDGSTVTAQVGGVSYELFTDNADGAGAAWVRHRPDEIKLLETMKRGGTLTVIGYSKRGTKTTDTYSLAGFADALDKIHAACGF
jgi:hypothetical protein